MKGNAAMPLIKELGLIWLAGNQYSSMSKTFSKLLLGMAAVVTLFIMCMQLVLFFLGSIAWLAYTALSSHGVSPEMTGLLMSASILALLACVVLTMRRAMISTNALLNSRLRAATIPPAAMTRIVDSFVDGFLVPSKPETAKPKVSV